MVMTDPKIDGGKPFDWGRAAFALRRAGPAAKALKAGPPCISSRRFNMNTNPYLNAFYQSYDEDSRLAPRHGSVEFLTTMRYIERYIQPGDRVIEIGAGTGRYSHALARRGYAVQAVELVEHNIEVFRSHTLEQENVSILQGNALDLSAFPSDWYDITLLLGPLYHLYTQEDKRQALREAIRVTKPGGKIFVAYVIFGTAACWTKASTGTTST